jgi:hypothetical protein
MTRKTRKKQEHERRAPSDETVANMRALVRVLARMAAEADYRASNLPASNASKGSIK